MATGFGVRYRSPIGPLRVDLGFKVNPRVLPSGSRERALGLAHLPGPGVLMLIGFLLSCPARRRRPGAHRSHARDRVGPDRDAVRRPHGAGAGPGGGRGRRCGRRAAAGGSRADAPRGRTVSAAGAVCRHIDGRMAAAARRGGGRRRRLPACCAKAASRSERLRSWVRDDLRVAAYLQQRFPADERRPDQIADWVSDLRRRTPGHRSIRDPVRPVQASDPVPDLKPQDLRSLQERDQHLRPVGQPWLTRRRVMLPRDR